MDKFYEGTLVLDGERIFTRDEIIETLKRNSDTISGYSVILLHRRIIKGDMILTTLKDVLSAVGVKRFKRVCIIYASRRRCCLRWVGICYTVCRICGNIVSKRSCKS